MPVPRPVESVVDHYLALVDRALPGFVRAFYLVGSTALGGFRPGRSDIDFVAIVSGGGSSEELRALRRSHRRAYARALLRAARDRSWPLACNGIFVGPEALTGPPSRAAAVAHQVAERFAAGAGFDVNPVTWWVLAHAGVPVRGPEVASLDVHLDDRELRRWTRANLTSFWVPWADALAAGGIRAWTLQLRALSIDRLVASGVLGASRMHATIATGRVISKDQAGRYALAEFGSRWHPIIEHAVSYWGGSSLAGAGEARELRRRTAAFVGHVADLAHAR